MSRGLLLLTVTKRTARPFVEVQKRVADLLKDKILVGHAVSNDLKAGPLIINHYFGILTVFNLQALLLSHPFPLTRDTQQFAYKYKLSKGRHPALRNLTAQVFGIQIQRGEHSSVCLILCVQRVGTCAFTLSAGYRRQGRVGDLSSPSSRVGKGEDSPVTIASRPRSLGPFPNTEQTETVSAGRGQRSTRRREERDKHRAFDDCQTSRPQKNEKYVIRGVEKKNRVVVRTGVFERFNPGIIEFLPCIQIFECFQPTVSTSLGRFNPEPVPLLGIRYRSHGQ